MNKISNEPALIGGLVIALFGAAVLWAMQMGWLDWDSEQLASFNNLVAALVALVVPVAVAYFVRKKVTPVANPKSADGAELVVKAE